MFYVSKKWTNLAQFMVPVGYKLPSSRKRQRLPGTQRRSVRSPAGRSEALPGQRVVPAPLPAAPTTGEKKGAPKTTHERGGRLHCALMSILIQRYKGVRRGGFE